MLCTGYLLKQDIPLVIVSHDREFLDQLCTKIVETEHGKATTYKGNYTQYVAAKAEKVALQWAAYEKQQKEIARQVRKAAQDVLLRHCINDAAEQAKQELEEADGKALLGGQYACLPHASPLNGTPLP